MASKSLTSFPGDSLRVKRKSTFIRSRGGFDQRIWLLWNICSSTCCDRFALHTGASSILLQPLNPILKAKTCGEWRLARLLLAESKFQSCKHNLRCTIAKYSSAHNSHFSYTAVTYSACTCTLHSYWMISLFLTWSCNAEQLEPLEVTWHLCSRLTLRPHHASTGMYSFCLKSRSFLKCGFWQNWRTEVLQFPNPVSIIIRCPIQNLGWDATQQQDRLGFVGKNSSSRNVVPDLPFLFFRLFCFASIFWICFKGGDKVVGCLSLLQSS